MKFCEKCGALMLPTKNDDETVLKCRECGHEIPLETDGYKVEFRVQHSPREKIVIVEEETKKRDEMSGDERRERRKAILEHFPDDE